MCVEVALKQRPRPAFIVVNVSAVSAHARAWGRGEDPAGAAWAPSSTLNPAAPAAAPAASDASAGVGPPRPAHLVAAAGGVACRGAQRHKHLVVHRTRPDQQLPVHGPGGHVEGGCACEGRRAAGELLGSAGGVGCWWTLWLGSSPSTHPVAGTKSSRGLSQCRAGVGAEQGEDPAPSGRGVG